MRHRLVRLAAGLFLAVSVFAGTAQPAHAAPANPYRVHCVHRTNKQKSWCQLTHRYRRWRWYENGQFTCLKLLWDRESGWYQFARNPYSGAYGIPQALPAGKMAAAGSDWTWDPWTQMRWGYSYIRSVYGRPCAAWQHELDYGWYLKFA